MTRPHRPILGIGWPPIIYAAGLTIFALPLIAMMTWMMFWHPASILVDPCRPAPSAGARR